ncbi:MAG: DUF3341 domain-containing protein [Planctomycetota bacterium]|nr:DUF3341 domain-containing protein [Planctomycetota bacterium]
MHDRDGDQKAVWGLMAEYKDPAAITHAAEKVRDAGYRKWDVYSPFPIHGMDEAMGLPGSRVGFIVGMGALLGVTGAMLMQWWMSAVDYKIVVAGKPFFAWEQFTPITFELGVLLSAFGAIFGMLALNGLPLFFHPLFKKERFLRVSDDRFMIVVESADPNFDVRRTRELLEKAGGYNIETVED